MPSTQALAHWDSPFINFRDFAFPDGRGHGYRWVHMKRFHLPYDAPDDRDLLAALLAHPEFRDTYDGAGVWLEPRHGQWWSDRISADTYLAVDEATATGVISSWATDGAGIPADLEKRLHEAVYTPIRQATSRYALRDLPDDAHHDYGPIHIEFHELVLVDRSTGVLTLLVAADD
ncbi:hypothetical protein D8771_23105 [Streptomyces albus]|uniref:Uncharacterized protein n=1 Tax=Streptomyces albus TaxID=1888 RepID=A0A8H1QNB9_9ACTN|nr:MULTISPECIES: hypothetical protein [Streptomyces]TGG80051.1 hypothetical protein D8771_23105 [Streptomyces albus]TXJ80010.1 hypothetical protein E2C11_11545 [Streptomyces lavendulae]